LCRAAQKFAAGAFVEQRVNEAVSSIDHVHPMRSLHDRYRVVRRWRLGSRGAVGYRDLVGAQLMATLFLGMIEPGKCGRHEQDTGDQLLLVNADSAAKSGFASTR
jgi:hypothetical protein